MMNLDSLNLRHIVVVEDDFDTRANLRDILELDGFSVSGAGSAAEALSRADWAEVFAVILDRRLPDGTADQILPKLRQVAPDVSVIIVTGYADLDGVIAALRQGADDYILKPVDAGLLLASVNRIVKRRQAEEDLRRAQQRLVQGERLSAIGEAMTGLVHESRNALQRSQACLELLALRLEGNEEAIDLIDRIQRAQDDLHQLYEEVREYAAPLRLRLKPVDVADVLGQAWEELHPKRAGRRACLTAKTGDIDTSCDVDTFGLRRAFSNILENALAACDDPTDIEATFSDARLRGTPALAIELRDNGPGLDQEQVQRIFDAFFTTKTHGTGLGMAIVKRTIDAHGGRIEAGNANGAGAMFRITLPRKNG